MSNYEYPGDVGDWVSSPPLKGPSARRQRRSRLDHIEMFFAVASVFFAPMNFLRYPDFYLTLSDVFTFACLFMMLVNNSLPLRPFGSATPLWMVGIAMLISGLLVSSIVNGDPSRGIIVAAQYFQAFLVLPMIIVMRPWWQVIVLMKVFVFSIFVMCAYGIYLIDVDGQTNTNFVSGNGRLLSFVERANECAALIALTIPLLLWLSGMGCIHRFVTWAFLLTFVYGIMLTGSNTGLLVALLGICVFFLGTVSWKRFMLGIFGAIGSVAIIGTWGQLFLPQVFLDRVFAAYQSGELSKAGTFSDRLDLIFEALRISDHTTLIGLGVDQYREVSEWGAPVHNTYLLILAEGGLLALIGLVVIIAAGFMPAFNNRRQPRWWIASICTFCTVLIFAALINATAHVYGRFWIVPLVLAMAVSLTSRREGPVPWRLCKYDKNPE